MTLALLITAATGARAAWTGGTYTATANETLGAITVNGDATLTINSDVTVTVYGGINIASGTLTVTGPGTLVVTGAKGNNGASGWNGGNGGNGGVAISGNIIVQGGATVTANGGSAGSGGNGELEGGKGGNGGNAFSGTLTYKSGTVTARGGSAGSGGWGEEECASSGSAGKAFANDVDFTQTTGYSVTNGTSTIGSVLNQPVVVISGGAPAGPEVTINDDKTEASFEMPTYDVNFSYELVRDMSVQMTATMGDGTDGERYRVKKSEQNPGKYEPAEMEMMDVLKLVAVNDGIEQKALTLNQDYFCRIYKLDEQTQQPADDGVELADFDFAPGLYALKAFATDGSGYDGETALSNTFVLFEGYQVVIPAGEYVTYYKDEAVRLDEKDMNDIELCTITAVEDGKAVLSDNFDAMKANTPILLKNTTTEEKTILLIPCNEPNLAVTVADEFIGTLTEKTFSDEEMGAGDFYVCNGKEFIKVRGAGTLAANKAYLKVTGNAPASIPFRRSIDGGEGTTGIDASLVNSEEVNSVWYDLNGRRLQGKPSQKGVYIKNGKKVIVP